jgi:hypothetical protein
MFRVSVRAEEQGVLPLHYTHRRLRGAGSYLKKPILSQPPMYNNASSHQESGYILFYHGSFLQHCFVDQSKYVTGSK